MLAQKIAQERSATPNPRPQEQADEIMAFRELVASCNNTLRRKWCGERTEQRHAMLRATLSEAQTALRDAHAQAQQLRDALAAAEAQLSPPQGANPDGQMLLPPISRRSTPVRRGASWAHPVFGPC